MTCFKKLIAFLTLISFCFVGESFARHHRRDKEFDTSRIGVKPSHLSRREKKQFRKETKKQITASKLPRKAENRRRASLKKQIAQDKLQQRKERLQMRRNRIGKEPTARGSKTSNRRSIKGNRQALTTPQAQAQIDTLLNQFRASKNFKHLKGYMEKVQSLRKAYPDTFVPPMRMHVTKKKKRSFGKTKKSENVYMMGPETNYQIVKI